MSEFGPEPSETAADTETEEWIESQDTRGRIRTVVTGLREPTSVAEIAEQTHCSANAARKHLSELSELGIVRRTKTDSGHRYSRNDAYFQWRRANELAEGESVESLLESLAELEDREAEFQAQFSAPTPEAVEIPQDATHDQIESRVSELREWATVRKEIGRHTDAVRLARRSDDGLTA